LVNTVIFEYWKEFHRFGDICIDPEMMERMQTIDREIRNILPAEAKGKQKEGEITYYYGHAKKNCEFLGMRE